MLRRPPEGSAALAWCFVGAWVGVIYATVPFARRFVDLFKQHELRWVFGPLVYALIAAGLLVVLRSVRQRVVWVPSQWLALAAVAAAGCFGVFQLRRNPEEALHFVEYGVLALLVFRAEIFAHRDRAVYVCAAAATLLFGIGDEAIQWLLPSRHFDFRDIAINGTGGLLMVLAIALGLRPPYVARAVPASSAAAAFRLAGVCCAALFVCVSATPARVIRILPVLSSLDEFMIEYGHRYEEAGTGVFFSRLTPEDFTQAERERGDTLAAVLAGAGKELRDYEAFLAAYTPVADPLLHEARVHLFRRDRYAGYARRFRSDEQKLRGNAWVARREHEILVHRLPGVMARPEFALPEHVVSATERLPPPDEPYVSPVSNQLFTRVGEGTLQAATGVPALCCLLLARWFSWRARKGA